MKSKLFIGAAIASMAMSCANAAEPDNYSVTVNLSPDDDGTYVYIMDYDTRAKIDSALVENGAAKFSGNIKEPFYARLILEGNRLGDVIIEPAQITATPSQRNISSNGALYGKLETLQTTLSGLAKSFREIPDDSAHQEQIKALYNRYTAMIDSTMEANIDNALGYMLFLESVNNYDLAGLDKMVEKHPRFKNSQRVQEVRKHLLVKEETSPGHKYKDFAITNDGVTQRLSDYVGADHYTLVDFWASWCGPCIRETKVLKKLYEKYNGKGLEILGVAVWDEPQNTKKVIETHQLPWKQIINAQTIPTDLYGISGIPCIILIAPDGTIVSRDKQDEDLINDVDKAMSGFNAATDSND